MLISIIFHSFPSELFLSLPLEHIKHQIPKNFKNTAKQGPYLVTLSFFSATSVFLARSGFCWRPGALCEKRVEEAEESSGAEVRVDEWLADAFFFLAVGGGVGGRLNKIKARRGVLLGVFQCLALTL